MTPQIKEKWRINHFCSRLSPAPAGILSGRYWYLPAATALSMMKEKTFWFVFPLPVILNRKSQTCTMTIWDCSVNGNAHLCSRQTKETESNFNNFPIFASFSTTFQSCASSWWERIMMGGSNRIMPPVELRPATLRSTVRSVNLNHKTLMSHRTTKPTKWQVHPAKTQNSLGIRPVRSEPSLCAQWVAKDPRFLQRMPRLIWVFPGHTSHFVGFVMRRLI